MYVWSHQSTIFNRRHALRAAGLIALCVAITATLFFGTASQAAPGVNQSLSFQGRLLNSTGGVVPDGYYNMQFKIYQDGAGTAAGNPTGTLKWTESYINNGGTGGVEVKNGYFSVNLGSNNPFGSSVDWNQDTLWLSMNVAGTSASCTTFGTAPCTADGEMLPMKRLTSTPYALNAGRLGGLTSDGFIQNSTSPQTANFNITGTGIAGTLQATTTVTTPSIDRADAGVLSVGTTNATSISLEQDVTVAAGQSLTLVGGDTASRPASPTEGMLYYDTTTKQLLVYSNGKWQGDRTGAVLVAASNSSDAEKAAADYVADGTGDQAEINSALTAADPAGSGRKSGKVYLFGGTFTINATISVPNNTTLSGAGAGTVITIPNSVNATFTAITNTTTGGNGTGVVIQDLKLDGNKANQSAGNYGMYGITFNGMGSSTLQGGKILNVSVNNWYGNGVFLWTYSGIYISTGSRNTISNVTVQGNSNNGIAVTGTYNTITGSDFAGNKYGIYLAANNNVVTGNSASTNTANGIYLNAASQNTISGNVVTGNTTANIYLTGSNSNTISGNQALGSASSDGIGLSSTSTYNIISSNIIQANSTGGVSLASSSSNNTITANKIHNNGGNHNKGVYFNSASNNTVTNNTITDTVNTASNNPINIDASSSNTYLSGNNFSSTATGGTIADAGTGTVYVNQSKAEGGGQITNRVANDAGAFTFQNASGTNVLAIDTANSQLLVAGTIDTTTASTLSLGTSAATGITLGSASIATTIQGNTGVTLNGTAGATMVCLNASGYLSACDVADTDGFIQNQNSAAQTANFWIDGTTRADTSVLTPTLDTATAVALNIGTTNATSINLNQDVTVAAGQSLTLAGGNTASRPASPTEGMVYYDTDTKQLLTYANSKWQGDRATSTKVVAASNSSQALKDSADYVATGTSDQDIINTALTAAAGGKVYLAEGTYNTDDAIHVPNNTTLAGSGHSTLVQLGNIAGQTKNMIDNTDQSGTTGEGVVIRDLRIDGNSSVNTTGTIYGIYMNNLNGSSGASARSGARVANVWVLNMPSNAIFFNTSPNGSVTNSTIQGGLSNGIYLSNSNRIEISNNTIQGTNGGGIWLAGTLNVTVTSNVLIANGTAGISLNGSSSNNTISANNLANNGGSGDNNSIALSNVSNNQIIGNSIVDNSGTGAAIDIDSASANNYLADNVFSGTGASSITDASTTTVYANQSRAANGGQLTNRTANDTQAFAIQKADGTDVLKVDTTNSKLLIAGSLDTTTATTLSIGTAIATDITIGKSSTNTTTTVLGTSIFKPTSGNDSTTAFQLQRADGTAMFVADSVNQTISIGNVAGGNIMSISTSTGEVTYYGSARRTKKISLNPEYTGSVLDAGTGSNNTGTMTSSVDLTNRMNYYKWTTSQATNQSYDVVVQVPLPSDFDGWASSNPLSVSAYTSNTTNGTITLEARDSGGTVRCNFVSITPVSADTWTTNNSACTLNTGTYTAGDYMTLRIRMQSPTSGDVRVGNINLSYLSKY